MCIRDSSEAARNAQAMTGKSAVSQGDMIKAMEAFEMTEDKMTALGLANFGPSFKVTCQNHGGDGLVGVAQWDAGAGQWSMVSDYKQSDQAVVAKLIAEDSAAYAAENNITPNCS